MATPLSLLVRIPCRILARRAFSSNPSTTSKLPETVKPVQRRFLPVSRKQMYEGLLRLVPDSPPDSRILRIALLGLPGVGKSSLVNRLAIFQACAVSKKVNTTRSKQNVTYTQGNTQLVFLDLPGLMWKRRSARNHLTRTLIRDPHAGIFEADLICVVVDVSNGYQRRALEKEVLQSLHFFRDKPTILVLTKTDTLGKKTDLLPITRRLTTGVVNNVLSVRDRYRNREPKGLRGPDPQELLERPSTQQLAEAHQSQLPPEEVNALLAELEAMRLEPKKAEEEEKEEENAFSNEKPSGTDIEAYFEKHPPMSQPVSDPLDSASNLNAMDGMMIVLREQMMLRSASRAEVAARLKRWRAIEESVRTESAWPHFKEVFMVSATSGQGVDNLREYLLSQAQAGPWAYHSELASDQDPHDTVEFAVYAHCLNNLTREIPYELRIEIDEYEHDPSTNSVIAEVSVLCRTERHLKHLIGVGGSIIRTIAEQATSDLEAAFGVDVQLRLKAKLAKIPKSHLQALRSAKHFRDVFPSS